MKLDGKEIIFLDSFRIFPVSLNELCEVFGVEGKISKYKNSPYKLNIIIITEDNITWY